MSPNYVTALTEVPKIRKNITAIIAFQRCFSNYLPMHFCNQLVMELTDQILFGPLVETPVRATAITKVWCWTPKKTNWN